MNYKRYKIQITKYRHNAFTLIEVLVSVGIFLMTIMAISQIFVTVISSEKVAYALLNTENNVRNNLELMAKTIRMGKNFQLFPDNQELCFDYYLENQWKKICYEFNDSKLLRSIDNGNYLPLFDPKIKVNFGKFYQIGDGSTSQLSFIIALKAEITIKNATYPFYIETAVTSRYINP